MILTINVTININNNTPNDFQNNVEEIRNFLLNSQIIRLSRELSVDYYRLNTIQNNIPRYFIIPIGLENGRNLELVYSSSNLYFQGFISEQNGQRHYYHFRSTNTDPVLERIEGLNNNNHDLGYSGDYNSLMPENGGARSDNFQSYDIINSFETLSTIIGRRDNYNNLRRMLFYIILATSESLRFNIVSRELGRMLNITNEDRTSIRQLNFNYFLPAINNWSQLSLVLLNNNSGWVKTSVIQNLWNRIYQYGGTTDPRAQNIW